MANRARAGCPSAISPRTMRSASSTPIRSRRAIRSRARRCSPGARSRNHVGSGGGAGFVGLEAASVAVVEAFGAALSDRRAFSIRSASGDAFGPSLRAASIASLAAVSDPNGPRTSGNPSSSVCSLSTITHVPDCGSIANRPSRVSQRPPPRRRSESPSAIRQVSAEMTDDGPRDDRGPSLPQESGGSRTSPKRLEPSECGDQRRTGCLASTSALKFSMVWCRSRSTAFSTKSLSAMWPRMPAGSSYSLSNSRSVPVPTDVSRWL